MDDLQGSYVVERVSGALPPWGVITKSVSGNAGTTRLLDEFELPFRVERRPGGLRLRYEGGFAFLADDLDRGPDGTWEGRATAAGVEYARFRLVPRRKGKGRKAGPWAAAVVPLGLVVRTVLRRRRRSSGDRAGGSVGSRVRR